MQVPALHVESEANHLVEYKAERRSEDQGCAKPSVF